MKKILLCDDEERIRDIVKDFLVNEGYMVVEAKDGEEALEKINDEEVDLAILDVMMPKLDGWVVCKEIRRLWKKTPIIMLTAKGEEVDELYGFEIGADEYIVKPFKPSILVARVNALLRRVSRGSIYLDEDLIINDDFHEVKLEGELIDLSPKEYELLLFLYENMGNVFSRKQLLDKIWGLDSFVTDRTVDTHINRLRIKLNNKRNYIKTVRGFGYKFEVDK